MNSEQCLSPTAQTTILCPIT